MTICSSDIYSITQSVLETMVNLGPCEGSVDIPSDVEHMTGCVQISGTWKGAVLIQTTEGFARIAASHMLALNAEEVTAADMQDTLAEITNMIGGNIKSQVPGPSYLSIPSVTTGLDFDFRLKGAVVVSKLEVHCDQQPLSVVICEGIA